MRVTASGTEILIEKSGFKLAFRPRLAIAKELSDPISIELLPTAARVRFPEGVGILHFIEKSTEAAVIAAEADGASDNGLIAELRARLEGFDRLLLYHFTYELDRYFQDAPEPFQYPQFREAGEFEYCPWSYPIHASSFEGLPTNFKISQLLCKGAEGYLFVLPVSNAGARGYLSRFEGGGFSVLLHSAAPTRWRRALLLVLSASPNPYRAVEAAYEAAFTLLGKPEVLRTNKRLPEVFRYLGWCSWNACWREPTSEKTLAVCQSLLEKGIKPGFVLIDDGWQDEETAPWPGQKIRRLLPDERKFPVGFAPLIEELRKLGVKYVGLWHTLNVHWGGVANSSELARRWNEFLIEVNGRLVPNPDKAFELFKDWYCELKRWGFDFVKVDNQSFVGYTYAGRIPIEEAALKLHEGLEAAAHLNSLDVLNCMAQQPENTFNWLRSTVARNCIDYVVPHRKSRNKLHLYFNAYNALFMSQVVWPDWDMFQSHDPWALQQAVARAVSGGPVYITDEPGKTVAEIVKPLAFSDGSLPLPDFPALPTEDVLMQDPYNEPIPLKIFTHVTVEGIGTYGIVAAFNIHRDDVAVKGCVKPSDALLPQGRYWIYEYFSGELRDREATFELEPMGVKLFIIAPRTQWLTPFGLKDVYVMPRGIDFACIFGDEAVLKLRGPGLLIAKTERKVRVEGGEIIEEEPLLKVRCISRIVRMRI